MRRIVLMLGAAALVAAVVVGLAQSTGSNSKPVSRPYSPAAIRAAFAGSPPALARVHAQASQLIGGGTKAVRARLRELRGHPVVLNKWGSWCGPCRFEFPFFQRVAVTEGRGVAFLGLNIADNRAAARDFLRRFPVPFPSYKDPHVRTTTALDLAPAFQPVTAFYDRRGKRTFLHLGPYRSEADLRAAVRRYAR